MIWRCDIKATGLQPNRFHLIDDSLSPLKIFSGVETTFDLKLRHTWGCPAYIMDAKLQNRSGGLPKWEPRPRLDIYLGQSPIHSRSVTMVLNPKAGHMYPQYHIVFTTILQPSLI